MFPDFPEVKRHLQASLYRWIHARIPQIAPLLAEIPSHTQHEGRQGLISRQDRSTDTMDYQVSNYILELSREEMMTTDLPGLFAKLTECAQTVADAQESTLFASVASAAGQVGNTLNAEGELEPKHLLELLNKVQMDFDPVTEEPRQIIVMHPETAAKVIPKIKEWEKDPQITAELDQVLARKREEWRAREDCRKLAD